MVDGGRPLEVLDDILEQYRVVQHGVSMYFGSVTAADGAAFEARLKRLVKRTKTPFISDHLCWGSVDGTYTHDLLPLPYTFEAARKTKRGGYGRCGIIWRLRYAWRTSAVMRSSTNPR